MLAADKGHSKVVARLLKARADPNTTHEKGATTLGWAAGGGHVETMQVLIEAGAAVNLPSPGTGRAPLMDAAQAGEVEALRLLLRNGADVNARSETGSTALMATAEISDPALYPRARRCAALLLAHGADARLRDTEGRTANDYALLSGHPVLAALLTSGPNP